MKRSRFGDSQILTIFKQADAGPLVPELCGGHVINAILFKY